MPSRRTIERILERHGRTGETPSPRRVAAANGYPAPRALAWGDLQETDLVEPRHLRTARGPLLFFSFHTVDVAGGGAATGQFPDKSAESFCAYLVEIAWPCLGLPRVWQVDNEAALAGYPGSARIFTQPVRLALLLGVEVRFIPEGEPGRNADVESFNDLWQERVLRRFTCRTAHYLARVSARFERWFMEKRPHPKLSLAPHGTRFPAVLRSSLDGEIRTLPRAFRLDDFRDREGQLRLPLARGGVRWVRRVGEDGAVVVAGQRLRLGRAAANRYVLAALSTARRAHRAPRRTPVVSRWRFPINEHVVQPLRPRGE